MRITVKRLRSIIAEASGMNDFPKWEDLSRKEQAAQYYSDVYKEKYGVRPMLDFFEDLTDDEAEAELEKLYGEKGTAEYYPDEFAGDDEYEDPIPLWPEPPVVNAPHHQDLEGTVDPNEEVFAGEELPSSEPLKGNRRLRRGKK
jgi:hypothetical protein